VKQKLGLPARACASVLHGARTVAVCVGTAVLAACAQAPNPLYDWQVYPASVYAYLKDEDADFAPQVEVLEGNAQRVADAALPPGFRAHLGMLYLKMGLGNKAVAQLQAEKRAFPEGATFMDFLLRNVRGRADVSAASEDVMQPSASAGVQEPSP